MEHVSYLDEQAGSNGLRGGVVDHREEDVRVGALGGTWRREFRDNRPYVEQGGAAAGSDGCCKRRVRRILTMERGGNDGNGVVVFGETARMLTRGAMREQIVFGDVKEKLSVAVERNHDVGLADRFFVDHHLKQLLGITAPLDTAADNDGLVSRLNETQRVRPSAVAVHVCRRRRLRDVAQHKLEGFDAVMADKCGNFANTETENVVAEE